MRATIAACRVGLAALAMLVVCAGRAGAQQPPLQPPPLAATPTAPAPVPAVAEAPAAPAATPPAAVSPAATASEPAAPEPPGPIPTGDATPAASDHDLVVGHLGVAARKVDTGPLTLALRPGQGCAADGSTPCTVTLGALGARYWMTRNLALNGYLALGTGGGSIGSQDLDTYLGVGPLVGVTLLLANWRHLAVGASPELGVIWFRPAGGDVASTLLVEMRASVEAELHFGFIGVPALSIGLQAGAALQYERSPDAHLWSVGVIGAGSIWDALSTLFVRYYL